MSDSSDFDKEAERKKLREKYEEDKKDRESTQRMSELLLQGATMTGKHCNNCGDPIFRYDGQEFCPSCQNAAQEAQAETAETPESTGQTAATEQEEAEPETTAKPERPATEESTDDEPRIEINDVRVAGQHSQDSQDAHDTHSTHRRPPSQRESQSAGSRESVGDRSSHRDARTRSDTSHSSDAANGDLDAARSSLVRKLTDLARQAEATSDVARSRELLAATREAAEALDALDRANR